MKIYGMSSKELSELRLCLRSTDVRFSCQFRQNNDTKSGLIRFDKDGQACIEFRDSYEIDQLINILQRFKQENRQYIGEW